MCNDDWEATFRRWYPGFRIAGDVLIIAQADTAILADQQRSVRIIAVAVQRTRGEALPLGIVEADVHERRALMLRGAARMLIAAVGRHGR